MTDEHISDEPRSSGAGAVESYQARSTRALELRMAGLTFAQIATAVGWASVASAHKAVQQALAREESISLANREHLRHIQWMRCERLIRGSWANAARGDSQAVQNVTKLLDRQAKLCGLDAPAQVIVHDATRSVLMGLMDELEREVVDVDEADLLELGPFPLTGEEPHGNGDVNGD